MEWAPLVLLLLLAFKRLSAVPSCFVSSKDFGKGDVKTVVKSPAGRYVIGQYFYLHYKKGFDAVELKIDGSSGEISMWFDAGGECFAHPTYWWRMHVTCGYAPDPQYLWCVMEGGDCRWQCNRKYISEGNINFRVVAHGPSAWRFNDPEDESCSDNVTWIWQNRYPSDDRPCMDEPGTQRPTLIVAMTPDDGDFLVTILAVVVVVVVAAVMMAVGIVIVKMKLRRAPRQ